MPAVFVCTMTSTDRPTPGIGSSSGASSSSASIVSSIWDMGFLGSVVRSPQSAVRGRRFILLQKPRTTDHGLGTTDQFHETAAVLEEVVADGAGPQDAHQQLASRIAVAARQFELHLLAEQALRS